ITSANSADGKAQQAIMKAEEGFNKAQEALTSVVSVDNKAEQAMNKAQDGFDKAQENADVIDVLGVRVGDAEDNFTTISGTVQGLQTTVQNKVDASTYSSKMTQLDSLINTKVSQADADNRYTMQTTFNQFADGFEQRVEAIEDWEIGGRNLIVGKSNVFDSSTLTAYDGFVLHYNPNQTVDEWGVRDAVEIRAVGGNYTSIIRFYKRLDN